MTYTEKYQCDECGAIWIHEWDTEDYNNDFTQYPKCDGFNFEECD